MRWFRFYSDALDNPKVQRLPGELFKAWVNLLCLANRRKDRGVLPAVEDVAFALRVSDDQATEIIRELVRRGLLDEVDGQVEPHDWGPLQPDSDTPEAAAERKRRQRDRERKTKASHGDSHGDVTVQNRSEEIAEAEENRPDGTEDDNNTRAGGNEPEDDDVNASEARCAMWAEFEDRLTDGPSLSKLEHNKATAAVEGIINGEARTAWLDPRGMPVPWTDRPRLFKLALAERIASGGNLHNILRGLIIPREYDPFPVKQSTDPKPGSEAERVKQTPGAETPGRGRGRTTAEQDTAPRQYIPSAEDEAARKQRREQEEAEQRQREDSLIRGWEMQDEVTAKRVKAEAALSVGENKFVPAHLKERATVEEYRQRVLAILKHDGDEAAA